MNAEIRVLRVDQIRLQKELTEYQEKVEKILLEKGTVSKEIRNKWVKLAQTEQNHIDNAKIIERRARSKDLDRGMLTVAKKCVVPFSGFQNQELCQAWLDQRIWDEALVKYNQMDMPEWNKQVIVAHQSELTIDVEQEKWEDRM